MDKLEAEVAQLESLLAKVNMGMFGGEEPKTYDDVGIDRWRLKGLCGMPVVCFESYRRARPPELPISWHSRPKAARVEDEITMELPF